MRRKKCTHHYAKLYCFITYLYLGYHTVLISYLVPKGGSIMNIKSHVVSKSGMAPQKRYEIAQTFMPGKNMKERTRTAC